jgi:hypothetical protein
MSQQKYLQDLIAAHQVRLEELKKAPPVKSSFKSLKGLLGIEQPKPDKTETLQEVKHLEAEIKRLQAELKKIEAAKEVKPAPTMVQRETLATTGFAPELIQTLQQAALITRRKNKQVMTVEIVLLAILTLPEVAAHRLLRSFSQSYDFNRSVFFWHLDRMSNVRLMPASNVDFVTDKNEQASLSRELLAVLNRATVIAKAHNESRCNTSHLLAAIAGLSADKEQLYNDNKALDRAAWLFQRLGITEQTVTEAMTVHFIPSKSEQQNRSTSSVLRKMKEPIKLKSLEDTFMAKVVIPLNLDTETEAQIRAEYQWLFAALDHYRQIQQIRVDLRSPVPVVIPPTAEKKDKRADNRVMALDYLLPSFYSRIEMQMDSILNRIKIHFNNLNLLLEQEAKLSDAIPANIALKNQIKTIRRELVKLTQEAAALMQRIYGVMIHSPAELVEFLD